MTRFMDLTRWPDEWGMEWIGPVIFTDFEHFEFSADEPTTFNSVVMPSGTEVKIVVPKVLNAGDTLSVTWKGVLNSD